MQLFHQILIEVRVRLWPPLYTATVEARTKWKSKAILSIGKCVQVCRISDPALPTVPDLDTINAKTEISVE